jgi:hypothetical protein
VLRCKWNHSGRGTRRYFCNKGYEKYQIGISRCKTPRVDANNLEKPVAVYLTRVLNDPDMMRMKVRDYLADLDAKILEFRNMAQPFGDEIERIIAKIRRVRKLYIDGHIDESEYQETVAPLNEQLAALQARKATYDPAIAQMEELRRQKEAIEQALINGSLVATLSSLRGLRLFERRSEEEQLTCRRGGGVDGICATFYKEELAHTDFTRVLSWLSLGARVYPDKVKVEGLIPLDIPMDDVDISLPTLIRNQGYSEYNRLRLA